MTETLGSTGEFGLIAAVTKGLSTSADVLVGPGDDAAVMAVPDGRMVITTDLLIEGRHFRQDWSSAYDVGRKAAAQNLSDVAAMGARPTALVVGFGAPAELPTAWALELNQGLVDECELVGASIIGGDTVQADKIVVSVTAFGSLDGRAPVLRSGARPGDEVAYADGSVGPKRAGRCSPVDSARRGPSSRHTAARSRRTRKGRGPRSPERPRCATSATACCPTSVTSRRRVR